MYLQKVFKRPTPHSVTFFSIFAFWLGLEYFLPPLLSVNTLMIAKPEKGQQVEAAIIQMAQSGQLGGKLSEDELIGLLERFAGSTKKTAVKFDRRRAALDSDSD